MRPPILHVALPATGSAIRPEVPWLSACRATTVRWLQHEFALGATDPEVLEEIEVMIAELERRRELGDGDAGEC